MRLAFGFLLVLCSLGILRAQPVCTFVGDAASLGGDCYQITDNIEWELGAVWFNEQLDLNQPFTINVDVNLGNQDADGADGVVFVMQSVGPLAIGDAGGGLGFEGFNPSFGVEIDTWQNTDIGDLSLDHVAFHRDGINWHNAPYFNLAGPVPARADGANIEDGQDHRFKLVWDPAVDLVEFYFDCTLRLSLDIDLVTEIFDGNADVWWGFTGSTGGSSNVQSVCITSSSVGLPPEHPMCAGEEVELILQSAEDGTISWSPADGLSNPNGASTFASPDVTTEYTATWTDVCGESLEAVTTVIVSDIPEPDLPETAAYCPGETVTLTANVPADAVSVSWTDGTPDATWTGADAGWQAVTVEAAGGCIGVDSTLVEALLPANPSLPDPEALCAGVDTVLPWPAGWTDWTVNGEAMPDGWSASPGTADIAAIEVATGCGFEATLEVDLVAPDPAALPAALSVCEGGSVVLPLVADPLSEVTWSPAGGLDAADAVQPTASPEETTTFTAEVEDVCGGIELLDIEVSVVTVPELGLPDSVALCPGNFATLEVEPVAGAPVPTWSNGNVGWSWTGTTAGWQSVTVEALPGCAGSDSTWVEPLTALAPVFDVAPLCPGEFAFIPFPDGWTNWTVEGTSEPAGGVTIMEPGNYLVQAETVGEFCPVVAELIVPSGALPDLGLPETVEFCIEQVVSLDLNVPGPVYWSDGVEGTSRQLNQAGTYTASYSTECGTVTDEVTLVEIPCGCTVFAPSAFTPDGDLINDAWRPSFDCEVEEYSLQIFNRWGAVVWATDNPDEYWTGGYREDGRPLDQKLYFVRDGLYSFLLTFRDPTFRIRRVERVTGHIQIIR